MENKKLSKEELKNQEESLMQGKELLGSIIKEIYQEMANRATKWGIISLTVGWGLTMLWTVNIIPGFPDWLRLVISVIVGWLWVTYTPANISSQLKGVSVQFMNEETLQQQENKLKKEEDDNNTEGGE